MGSERLPAQSRRIGSRTTDVLPGPRGRGLFRRGGSGPADYQRPRREYRAILVALYGASRLRPAGRDRRSVLVSMHHGAGHRAERANLRYATGNIGISRGLAPGFSRPWDCQCPGDTNALESLSGSDPRLDCPQWRPRHEHEVPVGAGIVRDISRMPLIAR